MSVTHGCFPYSSLASVTRSEARLSLFAARALGLRAWSHDRSTVSFSPWFSQGSLRLTPLGITVLPASTVQSVPPGAALALVAHHFSLGLLAVQIDSPLAQSLCATVLDGDESHPRKPLPSLSPLSADKEGVLVAIATRCALSLWSPSAPPVVLRAVTDDLREVFSALGLGRDDSDRVVTWSWRVTTPGVTGTARVLLAPERLESVKSTGFHSELSHCAAVGVTVSLVSGRARWPFERVSSLGVGDVLLSPSLGSDGEVVTGGVSLVMGTKRDESIAAMLTHAGVILSTEPDRQNMEEEQTQKGEPMGDGARVLSPERVANVGVEVSLELARMEVTVAEVSAWRSGEIVVFTAKVGDPVTVRAGGRALCRGELVVCDGNVGVRVVEFL